MSPSTLRRGEYRLRVGPVTLGVRLRPGWYQEFLPAYFRRPSEATPADFRLDIRVEREADGLPVPDSLFHGKRSEGRAFSLADGLVRGRRLPGGAGVTLRMPRLLLAGRLARVFEQLLYQAFYDAVGGGRGESFLVHAAGVAHGGSGYLFVGPAGAGKTTVAELSASEQVLNDELCLVRFDGQSAMVQDTPFNGFFPAKVQGKAPLRAVFLLHQGPAHRLLPVGRTEAAAGIFQQVVPPIGLDEPIGPAAQARMLEAADRLAQRVPVRRLEFRPDAGFWGEIDAAAQRGELP